MMSDARERRMNNVEGKGVVGVKKFDLAEQGYCTLDVTAKV